MAEMDEKLGAILNNPQMMQQIMSMAQSLGQSAPNKTENIAEAAPSLPDPALLQKLTRLASSTAADSRQQDLLHALTPFVASEKLGRLERAMRAAKMAQLASGFLGSGGLQLLTGR